jgi:hypothetical protein
MRLNDGQLQRLTAALIKGLTTSGRTELKAGPERVTREILLILRRELEREQDLDRDLDREAEKMLQAHLKNAPPDVDRHKLLAMIKKRLTETRGNSL